jgi:dihydroflavonol-4-reductase
MNFVLELGSGKKVEKALYEENVLGTRNVLDAATKEGVARVVVSSSAMTVGINPWAKPLDETADWAACSFDLPYALSRREAERESLARPNGPGRPAIMVVNPTLTIGPDDYVGAPTNKLIKLMAGRWFRFTAPIGMSVLDVRDFADGVLRAAESGQHGRRYILSGENLSPDKLFGEVAAVCGKRPPRFLFPLGKWIGPPITALESVCQAIGIASPVSRSLLELWGRYGWYDTTRARQELGWQPRPLRDTLHDTTSWLSAK